MAWRGGSEPRELELFLERRERARSSKRAGGQARKRKVEGVLHRFHSRVSRLSKADVADVDARFLSLSLFLSLPPYNLPSIVLANSDASAQLENFSPVIEMETE